ncbi:MAG: hypothetical protein Q9209_003450 [Squamulea sp. 1 TL-2023]
MLFTPSLADPIAFGNPTFNGIRFGVPFPLQWYGGDGTPVSIILNKGNPASLQQIGSVASESLLGRSFPQPASHNSSSVGLLSSPYTWTPVASPVVQPGVSYVLSIVQSGLTNYSPPFSIGTGASAPALPHMARSYGVPLPAGSAVYYPVQKPMTHDDPAIRPRNGATGVALPRTGATGVIVPRHAQSGSLPPGHYSTGVIPLVPKATPGIHSQAMAGAPFAQGTDTPIYSAATGTGASLPYAIGGRYNNVTATGTVGRALADESYPTFNMPTPTFMSVDELCDAAPQFKGCPNSACTVGADVRAMMVVVSAGCALVLFWI